MKSIIRTLGKKVDNKGVIFRLKGHINMLALNQSVIYNSNQNISNINNINDNEEKSTFTSYVRRKRPQQSAPANLNKRGVEGIGRQLK